MRSKEDIKTPLEKKKCDHNFGRTVFYAELLNTVNKYVIFF